MPPGAPRVSEILDHVALPFSDIESCRHGLKTCEVQGMDLRRRDNQSNAFPSSSIIEVDDIEAHVKTCYRSNEEKIQYNGEDEDEEDDEDEDKDKDEDEDEDEDEDGDDEWDDEEEEEEEDDEEDEEEEEEDDTDTDLSGFIIRSEHESFLSDGSYEDSTMSEMSDGSHSSDSSVDMCEHMSSSDESDLCSSDGLGSDLKLSESSDEAFDDISDNEKEVKQQDPRGWCVVLTNSGQED